MVATRALLLLLGIGYFAPTTAFRSMIAWHQNDGQRPGIELGAECEASFGMGCFWKPSEELLKVPGVIDTVVGYSGSPKSEPAPTYDSVCYSRDWVEGVRVRYDDDLHSFESLLDAFFEAQEPKLGSRQYGS